MAPSEMMKIKFNIYTRDNIFNYF